MNIIRQTIGQLFGTAREKDTMQQVSAVAVANAAEVDTTDTTEESQPEPVEGQTAETPAEPEPTESQPEPVEAQPVATVVAPAPVAAAPLETMLHISATELLRLQAGANAYEAIKAEHAQLKQWHTNAQGGIGLGPDANTATQTTARKVSAATAKAIKIAEESGMYNN